jgi:ribosomal protein L4
LSGGTRAPAAAAGTPDAEDAGQREQESKQQKRAEGRSQGKFHVEHFITARARRSGSLNPIEFTV